MVSNSYPKAGTSGVIESGGLKFHYSDIPMSGSLLRDSPNCPKWVREDVVYWVRHSIGGAVILGPMLRVEAKDNGD